jgi:putative endonuclease
MSDKIAFGRLGEDRACEYLKKQGYKILERNVRTPFGEIDIVARDKNDLCFVEVKNRRDANFGSPFEAMTEYKQRHLIRSAQNYLAEKKLKFDTARFDVVGIISDTEIELIKNAFEIG